MSNEKQTPMQLLFYRIEQLRFAKNPIDKIMEIENEMLQIEKDEIVKAANFDSKSISENGHRKGEQYYNETYGGNNYNETFKQCKCGMPQVGGWQCARTDCNQNELYGGNK